MMAAAFSRDTGMTAEELAQCAGLTKGTVATYIAPLLAARMIHISGWRLRGDGQSNYVREYLPGPQIKEPPPHPVGVGLHCAKPRNEPGEARPVPRDPILFALLGITERKAAA